MTARPGYKAAIIGAGISGLFMADRLLRAGIAVTVYEKAAELGGTWRDNTYPGLYVDVLSRQYEFPFRPNFDWSRKFAPQPEIQAYLLTVARERGWRRHIRFDTEIVEAIFESGRWRIRTSGGETDSVDVLISATGFLREPKLPDIAGREDFAGPAFHSARWDHDVALEGKRVGVIGSGASGIQIAETLAVSGINVTHFVRRPQWIHVRDNPRSTLLGRLALRLPFAYRLRARHLWKWLGGMDLWRTQPGPARDAVALELAKPLEAMRDADLREKLRPRMPVGCVRIPKSDKNYYAAMELPNAQVETRRIARIEPDGVRMDDGALLGFDVLVYATGFDAQAYMRPMRLIGMDGVSIDDVWRHGVFSYRGVSLPGFPNFFMLYGPFSPVNNVPIPIGLDQQTAYILRVIATAKARNAVAAPSR
jgi:cation diffusion facilitator CzcD-associated flavoprotein CzcO